MNNKNLVEKIKKDVGNKNSINKYNNSGEQWLKENDPKYKKYLRDRKIQ